MASVSAVAKTLDVTGSLSEGFTPTPIALGPDGIPIFPQGSTAPLREEPISLCALGPCIRYHELKTKLDAQDPLDGSEGPTYTQITRTCYPSAGIEMPLQAIPVRECTLWEPDTGEAERLYNLRKIYKTNQGASDWEAFEKSWPKKKDGD